MFQQLTPITRLLYVCICLFSTLLAPIAASCAPANGPSQAVTKVWSIFKENRLSLAEINLAKPVIGEELYGLLLKELETGARILRVNRNADFALLGLGRNVVFRYFVLPKFKVMAIHTEPSGATVDFALRWDKATRDKVGISGDWRGLAILRKYNGLLRIVEIEYSDGGSAEKSARKLTQLLNEDIKRLEAAK